MINLILRILKWLNSNGVGVYGEELSHDVDKYWVQKERDQRYFAKYDYREER